MREVRHHRLGRAARLLLCAGGVGLAWAAGVTLLGSTSDARADDLAVLRASSAAGAVLGIDITPPPVLDELASDLGLPSLPALPEIPDLPDLDILPDLPELPDLPAVSVPPTVPQLPAVPPPPTFPAVPELPAASVVRTPATASRPPDDRRPAAGSGVRMPSPSDAAPAPPPLREPVPASPWAFDLAPVTPPVGPTPPGPGQIASGGSSVLSTPPGDRIASPRAHFASFPEVSPPERGPPSDPAHRVDTSPD